MDIACGDALTLTALPGIPIVVPGSDLPALISGGLDAGRVALRDGDVLVVTSKIVSRSEGRFVDLSTVEPSPRAQEVAATVRKDPRLVELILREAEGISRQAPEVLVVRHRLGFVTANAGIDASNAVPPDAALGAGPFVLLLPSNPDETAEKIRAALLARTGAHIGVVISDSHGRPFRQGTVGAAIGLAGMPALWDQRGSLDLFGRPQQITITALADQVAAAADLVAGQGAEARPVVHVRGLRFPVDARGSARDLLRPRGQDLYA